MASARKKRAARAPVDRWSRLSAALQCPETGATGFDIREAGDWVCRGSGRSFTRAAGYTDFVPGFDTSPTFSQRLMETRLYSAAYEETFRPALTRLVTTQTVPDAIALSLAMLSPARDALVLDVGCGTGNFTRAIARRLDPDAGLVVGLDLSRPMLAQADAKRVQHGLRNVAFVRADAMRLPFVDGGVDAVHCAGSLHLMPDARRVLAEFARVLRPGGGVVIGTFARSSHRVVQRVQDTLVRRGGFRFFDAEQLLVDLADAGFEVRETMLEGAALTVAGIRLRGHEEVESHE
jgi:SAM-dependent methyltransferase